MDQPTLFTKDYLIISAANFFLYFTDYIFLVTTASYTIAKYHASSSVAGFASSIFFLGILASRLFTGRNIRRFGCRLMLITGFILYLLTTSAYLLDNTLWLFFLNRLLNGAAMGIASTSTGTVIAEIVPADKRGEGIGYYGLTLSIALAAGPFVGILVYHSLSFSFNIVICIVSIIAGMIPVFFVRYPEAAQDKAQDTVGFSLHNYFEPIVLPIALFTVIICLGYSGIITFLSDYTAQLHMVNTGSFFFVAYAALALISRPLTGRLFDAKGENTVIYPSVIVFALALLVLGLLRQEPLLLVAGALTGLGYGTISTLAQAIAVQLSPKERIPLAISTFFASLDVGTGLGPFALGLLVPVMGYRGMYLVLAALILLAFPVYYALHGRRAGRINS